MRNAFINTILDASQDRDDIFIISGDAGLGVFDDFKERYPKQFLNMGVAEQNTMSFAAGMSMAGFKVVVYNIIPFLLYRAYEQVRNDICYQQLPVILAGIGSGLTYAPQGMTHYAIEDIGIARTMPNLTVMSPIDPVEAREAAHHAIDSDFPVYVRLAKRGEPTLHRTDDLDIARPQIIEDGERVALVCHGSIAEEAVAARRMLVSEGLSPCIISVPMLQPLDQGALAGMLDKFKHVVSIEEHYPDCGLGVLLTELKSATGSSYGLKKLGIPRQFIHEIYTNSGMRNHFGIDAAGIAKTVHQITGQTAKTLRGANYSDRARYGRAAASSMDLS